MSGFRMRAALALSLLLMIAAAAWPQDSGKLAYGEQVFDFGHVAIEFRVFRTYYVVNETDHEVRITGIDASCDCSAVGVADSSIAPGDTAFFYLDYNTRNAYGPVTRSFKVFFENAPRPEIQFFYVSDIGRWPKSLKPDPVSVFFLPGRTEQDVEILNSVYKKLSMTLVEQASDFFTVELVNDEAARGEKLKIKVRPQTDLEPGTHFSSFTVAVSGDGIEKPVPLTIPVKIVKY